MNLKSALLLSLLFFCVFGSVVSSQDQILLMSGKKVDCKIIETTEAEVRYEVAKKNGKTKVIEMNKSEIYSITRGINDPEVFYEMAEEFGNWMNQEEMFVYIVGEQDARNNYNTKLVEILGYAVGAGFGYVAQGSFIFILLGPALYTGLQFIPMIKIKEEHLSDKSFAYNDFYLKGFEPVARTKKVMSALKSSFVGAIVGTIVYIILPLS